MAERMRLTTDGFGRVTISYTDPHTEERVTRTFTAPDGRDGYVRELADDRSGTTQPCGCLDYTGDTLIASCQTLPTVIRREYQRRIRRERAWEGKWRG